MRSTKMRLTAFLLGAALLCACGSGDGEGPTDPDPAVAPFVGTWAATDFTVTSVANPQLVEEIINLGATFSLNVQPSGLYTATLNFLGQPGVEIGRLSVSGSTLTMTVSTPPPGRTDVSTFAFVGDDVLILDGPTIYDFNADGIDEDALAHIELERN